MTFKRWLLRRNRPDGDPNPTDQGQAGIEVQRGKPRWVVYNCVLTPNPSSAIPTALADPDALPKLRDLILGHGEPDTAEGTAGD